ncbi:MAG: amidohydrolase family protein [Alphaproteobacteria bacterium]
MTSANGTQIIAIEEHYLDPDVDKQVGGKAGGGGNTREMLMDLGAIRLGQMDEAGIDIQVMSHCPPGAQAFDPSDAVERGRGVNDRLHAFIGSNPSRFGAFGTLPLRDPKNAPDELSRCVNELGFRGAMVHGLTEGKFIDDQRFWPIFERAQSLDVPIYVHPGRPHPAVIEAYYQDYAEKYPSILSAGWGFTVETATAGLRLVLSGVFDKYPDLKIILGHLGEGLPFSLWRIDHGFNRHGTGVPFRDLFRKHFWLTTSGNFSDSALLCTVMEMGVDRILYSVDWPYVENAPGTEWMEGVSLCQEDREKILNGNTKRLLKM